MPDIDLKTAFGKIMDAAFEETGCSLTVAECQQIAFDTEIAEVVSVYVNTEDYDKEGNFCPACEPVSNPEEQESVDGLIFKAMQDLTENADDVYWIGGGETVFERLASLFLAAGGDNRRLVKEWPEIF